jgi:3-oxoacyl-[acyl-carrier protein] reductase
MSETPPSTRSPGAMDGRVALVTGGSRGIGLAIARSLTAAGAQVVVTGRDEPALAQASGAAHASGAIHGVRADVREPGGAERAVQEAEHRFGGLDVLVNNAGIGVFAPVAEMSADDWRRTLDTNLTGVFLSCHAAIPAMKRRGGGWIINISSLASTSPFAGGAAYCASKAGLNAFSEALMQELRYDNIRVSTVLPGSVNTSFGRGEAGHADWKLSPEDVARAVADLVAYPDRSLPSRVELRPSRPRK